MSQIGRRESLEGSKLRRHSGSRNVVTHAKASKNRWENAFRRHSLDESRNRLASEEC